MKTLLVPVDFSPVTERVVRAAGELAAELKGKVVLLHVASPDPEFVGYETGPQSVRDSVARHLHDEHLALKDLEKLAAVAGGVSSFLVQGMTVEKIISEAARHKADLIVMGSHGHGMLRHLLVGSVTEGVLREASCPVVIVPPPKA